MEDQKISTGSFPRGRIGAKSDGSLASNGHGLENINDIYIYIYIYIYIWCWLLLDALHHVDDGRWT